MSASSFLNQIFTYEFANLFLTKVKQESTQSIRFAAVVKMTFVLALIHIVSFNGFNLLAKLLMFIIIILGGVV